MAFLALRALRWAPRPRQLDDGRTVYREEELEQFKTSLLLTVGVSQSNTPYQPVAQATEPTQPHPSASLPHDTLQLDPLMQLLARATIRHRVILLVLWSMIVVGGLCTLILF